MNALTLNQGVSLEKTSPVIIDMIRNQNDLDDMLQMVRKISALKAALDAVDQFRLQSVMYAKMAAEALVRVVELGGLQKLKREQRKVAEWLYSLESFDREKYISMCTDGLIIEQIYKREILRPEKITKAIENIKERRDEIVCDLKEEGIVDLTDYFNDVRRTLGDNSSLAEDIIDGTRKRMRAAGGVGIGEEKRTYVMPTKGNQEAIKKAILLRWNSLIHDFESIKNIAASSGVKMSSDEFYTPANWALEDNPQIIHMLLALVRIGLIQDEQKVYEDITKSDYRMELDYVQNRLKISKKTYLETQLQRLTAEEGSAQA